MRALPHADRALSNTPLELAMASAQGLYSRRAPIQMRELTSARAVCTAPGDACAQAHCITCEHTIPCCWLASLLLTARPSGGS